MLYSGIDLHKRTIAIHTVDADGAMVRKADLPTNRAAITAYFTTLDGPPQAVCECTGMWYWVRDLLVPQGIDLRLAHAKYLNAISYAKVGIRVTPTPRPSSAAGARTANGNLPAIGESAFTAVT